ncbi:putative U2-associated splicing factor [Phytophthora cinnamomi]|uniref:putative U2-associated splicing factor n=1 Tax=Phytophthora cinnamomi TaxID=4785 RepID=UPI00355AACC1|nr:putative U2-associated splicing factor [Phytophthora cinnamomi]
MDTLRVSHKNIVGRMSANAMKDKVMNVLTAWESWSLFPPAVLVGLHATFLRKVEEDEYMTTHSLTFGGIGEADLERLRKTCRQSGILASGDVKHLVARLHWLKEFTSPTATTTPASAMAMAIKKPNTQSSIDTPSADEPKAGTNDAAERRSDRVGEVDRENLDGEPIDEEDLDGDPIDEELSAGIESSSDIDGVKMDDEALDGEPLDGDAAEDELDGEPLDEDLDGAPMDEDDLDGEPI